MNKFIFIDFNQSNDSEEEDNDAEPKEKKPKSKPFSLTKRFGRILGGYDVEVEKNIKTRFSDVLGIDEFKDELVDIIDFLKNPKKYQDAGAKLPKGVLLVGPPGTGKTLLARAIAGEANCSFYYKTGSGFDEMYVGVGASRVRELFNAARENSPAIIFIDEIDSLAGKRRPDESSNTRDTLNQILTEMDGFQQSDKIIVIGATNMEQSLDKAIKRPGRFDKTIHIPLPDVKGRTQIFDYYLSKIQKDKSVDNNILARRTTGFSGADIKNIVNLAILNAVKNNEKNATIKDFEFAIDRIRMGIGRPSLTVSDEDKLNTAYHEGGHALVSLLTKGSTPLYKVTILPRGGSLGHTSMIPDDDQLSMNKKQIRASIDVCLGGRAAEEIFLGNDDITTGCSSDLNRATDLAYSYVRQLAMNEKLTMISQDKEQMSDTYNYMIDCEVQKMLNESYKRVKELLLANEDKLKNLATELIRKETLSGTEVKDLLNIK